MRWLVILPLLLSACATEPKPASLEPIWWRLFDRAQLLTDQEGRSRYIREPYVEASKSLARQAADDMRLLLAKPENRNLLQVSKFGGTALRTAVDFGLVEIVEMLLEFPEARAELEGTGGRELWLTASLAPYQSVRVCGDAHNNWPAMWLKGYYGSDPQLSPYLKVRELLEKAGVQPSPEEARAAWLKACTPVPPEESYGDIEYIPGARDRVAKAPDTLLAILAEIQSQVTPQGLPTPRF